MDYNIIIYNIYHNNHITLLGTMGSYDDNDTIKNNSVCLFTLYIIQFQIIHIIIKIF